MKVYKIRLYDETAKACFAYILADTMEEAEVKARWQYPGHISEVIGIVANEEYSDDIE